VKELAMRREVRENEGGGCGEAERWRGGEVEVSGG
jgi:hypothetical protein